MVGYCADVFVFYWRKNCYVKFLREFRHRTPVNGNWNANDNVGLQTAQLRWPNRWTFSIWHLDVPPVPSASGRPKLPTHFIKHTRRKKRVKHKVRKRKHLASFMALYCFLFCSTEDRNKLPLVKHGFRSACPTVLSSWSVWKRMVRSDLWDSGRGECV